MSDVNVRVTPGYTWVEDDTVSVAKLNLTATPTVELVGSFSSATIADGSVTPAKLANDAVIPAKLDSTKSFTMDDLTLTGNLTVAGTASLNLADGKIWIGDGSGNAVARTMSGAVTITNEGVAQLDSDIVGTLTAKATPVGGDLVWIGDSAAANVSKRTTVAAVMAAGAKVVQTVGAYCASTYDSFETQAMPNDGHTPTTTEGQKVIEVSITPTSLSNFLLIECWGTVGKTDTDTNTMILALFNDRAASPTVAKAATGATFSFATIHGLSLRHVMAVPSTLANVISVYFGAVQTALHHAYLCPGIAQSVGPGVAAAATFLVVSEIAATITAYPA